MSLLSRGLIQLGALLFALIALVIGLIPYAVGACLLFIMIRWLVHS